MAGEDERAAGRFEATDRPNAEWSASARGRRITVERRPLLSPGAKIFAMGSCFAVEIRKALRAQGYAVYPDYPSLSFDPRTQAPARLPERDNINHYDTFVIRQEIERALERQQWSPDGFWALERHRLTRIKGWKTVHQDPYRRDIYAADPDHLADLSARLGRCIETGLESADVVIITLGLTECWQNSANGLYVALPPRDEKDEIFPRVKFRPTTFKENYENLGAIVDGIGAAYPSKQIVLTVSPVALSKTWTGEDVVVANLTSKTTLRAAVGQLCRERPQLIYWPSFEYAMGHDVFKEDGRHVREDAVERIVGAFLETHSAGS
jgi:hypothetical protein